MIVVIDELLRLTIMKTNNSGPSYKLCYVCVTSGWFFTAVYRSQSSLGLTALPVFCPFSVFSSFALFCAIFFCCFGLFVRPPNVLHPLWRWRPTKRIVCVLVLLQFEDLTKRYNNLSFWWPERTFSFDCCKEAGVAFMYLPLLCVCLPPFDPE